jgi:arginine decarboxylase
MEWKMDEMAKLRGVEMEPIQYRIEELSVPMDNYGACVAALVFVEY